MVERLNMPDHAINRLFPKLDDLIDIHMTFLRNLQDLQNRRPDHIVEHIGETLVSQVKNCSTNDTVLEQYRRNTS